MKLVAYPNDIMKRLKLNINRTLKRGICPLFIILKIQLFFLKILTTRCRIDIINT